MKPDLLGFLNPNATAFGTMDNLTYAYDSGNKLLSVNDLSGISNGFSDGNTSGNDYSYDENGNMRTDNNKAIADIDYNHLNLPKKVELGSGKIFYTYDASGVKLEKRVEVSGNITTTYYAGNYIYEKVNSGSTTLQFYNHSEGYALFDVGGKNPNTFRYVYQYRDHLGNIRLSYNDINNDGEIEQFEIIEESNYYPFGLKHKGYNNTVSANGNSVAQKFGFEGVELEESLGYVMNEMDWRHYDPVLGRFNVIDPMAEERSWLNPYNFVQNNPILRVDPTGLLDDYGLDTDTGELVFLRETDDDTDTIYTGSITGVNDDGSAKFKKDGKSSKTFKKGSSNIKDITTATDEEGNTVGNGISASLEALVFSEGNLQIGLEVMEFISFESEIELSAWAFETGKGQGLYISAWDGNDAYNSIDDIDNDSDFVQRKSSAIIGGSRPKNYGKKVGHVHTHPSKVDGDGIPSTADKNHRDAGKNPKYRHFINSRYDGWTEYSKKN